MNYHQRKFNKRVSQVQCYLKGLTVLGRTHVSDRKIKLDAREVVREALKDNPNWLNEEW